MNPAAEPNNTHRSATVATQNACKLCTPYGATLAFLGLEGTVPLLHGSQGCATYIRRHMIGHFREPVDVASSNFHESAAIFGGRDNLHNAISNVTKQYDPSAIGIATTCLAETIGDNVPMILRELDSADDLPELIPVSTASYQGTHEAGYFRAIRAVVEHFCPADETTEEGTINSSSINILSPMVSPEDIRYLKQVVESFGLSANLLPDYADRLDGGTWEQYQRIPEGGTPLQAVREMPTALATLELGTPLGLDESAGEYLARVHGQDLHSLPVPAGVENSDRFFETLSCLGGKGVATEYLAQRGRLIDAMIDAHKYLFEKKAVVYGEHDLVLSVVAILRELGVTPSLCATGGKTGQLAEDVSELLGSSARDCTVIEGVDFVELEAQARAVQPDVLIGNSNGAKLSRLMDVPLLRLGMPIHDRIGASRIRLLGYAGAIEFIDRLCNIFIARQQDNSPVGYTHM